MTQSSLNPNGAVDTRKQQRVVFVLNSYVFGGVEEHVALLCRVLPNQGFDPVVICAETEDLQPLIEKMDDLGVQHIKQDFLGGGLWKQIKAVRLLAHTLRDLKADILHVQLISYYGGRVALLAGRMTNIPTVVTHHIAPHKPLPLIKRLERRPFVTQVKRFIAVSEANRQLQIRRMGLPPDRLICLHNGVFQPAAHIDHSSTHKHLCRELHLPLNSLLIGCIGRLAEQKGYHWLIEALPVIVGNTRDTHLIFIGDGELRETLQKQAERLGVGGRVHWMGFRSDAKDLMSGLDVLAMPSRFEGLPYALLEAMIREVPIVAHAIDGIPEALNDGIEGYLVPCGDVSLLAERLIHLLNNPELRIRMGQSARLRVLKHFTAEATGQRTASLYRDVLCEKTKTSDETMSIRATL